jgi:hypothetical protein
MPIDAQDHSLTIDDELLDPVLQRRLGDPRISNETRIAK